MFIVGQEMAKRQKDSALAECVKMYLDWRIAVLNCHFLTMTRGKAQDAVNWEQREHSYATTATRQQLFLPSSIP